MSEDINPYAVTSLGEPKTDAAAVPIKDEPRSYRLRMEWEDRQRFLQAVGPMRLFAVISAVTGLLGLVGLAGTTVRLFFEGYSPGALLRNAVPLAAYMVVLYIQWLNWKFAAALAATAGGTTASMRDWSYLQLRLIWLGIIYLMLHYFEWTVEVTVHRGAMERAVRLERMESSTEKQVLGRVALNIIGSTQSI